MTKNIEQVFILAAGRGERMRPLTDQTPKPLIKIQNSTMMDLIIQKLNQFSEIKKIIVNSYYLSEQIENHLQLLNNPKIVVSHENQKLETGGGILNALNLIDKNKPLLVINSDIVWKDNPEISDLKLLSDNFNSDEADILLGLIKKSEFWGYEGNGDFAFDEKTGIISRPQNHQNLNYVFSGIQIINPKIFENSPPIPFSMNYFYQKSQDENGVLQKISGIKLQGRYFHIGTAKAVKDFSDLNLIL